MHKKHVGTVLFIVTISLLAGCTTQSNPSAVPEPGSTYQEIPVRNGKAQVSEFFFQVPAQLSVKQWTNWKGEGLVYSLFRNEKSIANFECPIPNIDWENGGMGKRTDGVTKERTYQKNDIKYVFRMTTYGDNDAILGFVSPYSETLKGPDMHAGCSFDAHSNNITAQEKEQIFESMY